MVFQAEQGRQFVLVQFFHADIDVVGQDEVEEVLLFAVEAGQDVGPGVVGAFLAGEGRHGIGDVGEHVEEVAVLGVDDFLHLGELRFAEALFRQSFEEFGAGIRPAPQVAQFLFVSEEVRQVPEKHFHELLRGHGRAVGMPETGAHHVLDGAFLAVG